MKEYRFRVVIDHQITRDLEILELAEKLVAVGCDDGHFGGHVDGCEVVFDRVAESLDSAMQSAVRQIESCGLLVKRVELDRESIVA